MINELKEISEREGMSQAKIAHDLGVTLNTVNRWIKGVHKPHPVFQAKIKNYIKRYVECES